MENWVRALRSFFPAVLVAFSLLVIFTHGVATACLHAGPEGKSENLSSSDFLREYRRVLNEQRARYCDARIDGRITGRMYWLKASKRGSGKASPLFVFEGESPPEMKSGSGFSYAFSGGSEKLRTINNNPSHRLDSVLVSTDSIEFLVRRAVPGGPYFLAQSKPKTADLRVLKPYRNRVKNASYCVGSLPDFPEYVSSPNFRVMQVSRTTDSGRPVTKVHFQYSSNEKKNNVTDIGGWFRLETSMNWGVRDYEFKRTVIEPGKEKWVTQFSGSISYKQENGPPVPIQVKFKSAQNDGQVEEVIYDIDDFVLGPTPAEAFTLASFGLGDFERPSTRGTNFATYYALIFGVAALVASAALAWMGKSLRRRRPSATDTDIPC